MGHAADVWDRLTGMMESGDLDGLADLYEADSIYLEPYNPPHRGDLLIMAYLKDFFDGKDEVDIQEKRVIESTDGDRVAIEWTISYTAGGRRWNELPRASFLQLDSEGLITYHRDYT